MTGLPLLPQSLAAGGELIATGELVAFTQMRGCTSRRALMRASMWTPGAGLLQHLVDAVVEARCEGARRVVLRQRGPTDDGHAVGDGEKLPADRLHAAEGGQRSRRR